MHPAPRTDWYRRKQEQDREELNQLESEYHKRIKDLEEMEDNRKNRVADKVRQQQTTGGVSPSRSRGATLGASTSTGQSWSSVVKSGATAAASSGTTATAASSSRADGTQSPMRGTKAESKGSTTHKRQTSGGSSPVRGRGASPSRSSIQAGTVRKMQGSFTSSSSSGNLHATAAVTSAPKTTTKTSENRTRLNARSITTAAPKPVSLAPYAASAAPYSPSASTLSTSASRTRIARSPSISPTISAIASTFAGPITAPAGSRTTAVPRSATTAALSTSGQTTSNSGSTPPKAASTSTSSVPKRTAATTSYSAAASKATTPTITVTSASSKNIAVSPAPAVSRVTTAQTRARSSPSIASKSNISTSARTTTATNAKTPAAQNGVSGSSTSSSGTYCASTKRTIASPTPVRGRSTSPSRTPNSVSNTPPTTGSSPASGASTPTKGKSTSDSIIAISAGDSATTGNSTASSQVSTPFSSQPRLSTVPAPITLDSALIRGTRLEMREQYLIHSQGESVCVWDIPEQSCITVFSGHTAAVHTVALRPNNTVISASREEILVWEANTEKVFSYHPGCTAFAAHPTLNQIATSHKDGTISILNPLAAAPLRSFEGPEIKNCEISALVWSSATHLLVAKGKLIYLIDTTSSKIERIYQGHQGSILHIEGFSHENASASLTESSNFATHFFSLCSNDEVMCWQTESGTVTSKTQARGKCSSLFVLDDRHSKTLNTQLLLPILVDPEGVTVIATKEPNHIKMEDADIPISAISLISASTPVLLI